MLSIIDNQAHFYQSSIIFDQRRNTNNNWCFDARGSMVIDIRKKKVTYLKVYCTIVYALKAIFTDSYSYCTQ